MKYTGAYGLPRGKLRRGDLLQSSIIYVYISIYTIHIYLSMKYTGAYGLPRGQLRGDLLHSEA